VVFHYWTVIPSCLQVKQLDVVPLSQQLKKKMLASLQHSSSGDIVRIDLCRDPFVFISNRKSSHTSGNFCDSPR
jgi:hypothetical protein